MSVAYSVKKFRSSVKSSALTLSGTDERPFGFTSFTKSATVKFPVPLAFATSAHQCTHLIFSHEAKLLPSSVSACTARSPSGVLQSLRKQKSVLLKPICPVAGYHVHHEGNHGDAENKE